MTKERDDALPRHAVSNWGNFPTVQSLLIAPESGSEVVASINGRAQIVPRGNGRSYGDAALGSQILSSERLNRFIDFDTQNGTLYCEAGVLFSDILEVIVPYGFFLPVTPGTKFISVGGAIASDVHGKNHHLEGTFSDHLIEINLINAAGESVLCSPEHHTDLFWNTVGGMGLTGMIVSARFRLKRIETAWIRHESIKAANLSEIMRLFEESASATYTVAWIDCLTRGKNQGRSIMMRGEHALHSELKGSRQAQPLQIPQKIKLSVPFYFPAFTLNTLSVKAFNFLYYHKQLSRQVNNYIDYDTFFYPLDAIYHWNRIYGKNGFTQYQFVVPKEGAQEALGRILDEIGRSGQGSFLAVLKLFGKQNEKAKLSFPMEGYTLALDFKIQPGLFDLLDRLDVLVEQYGGRLYLAKDVRMKKQMLGSLAPHFERLLEDNKFASLQFRRMFT
jgi:FAD/FMN-containing dehydrogenase